MVRYSKKISSSEIVRRLLPDYEPRAPYILHWFSRPTYDVVMEKYLSPFVNWRVISVFYQELNLTVEIGEIVDDVDTPLEHKPVIETLSNDFDVIVLHPTVTPEMLGQLLSLGLYGEPDGIEMRML